MYEVGSIVNIKNIVFKSTHGKSKYTIDHSYKTGRPCLIFHENSEYIYFFSINSYKGKDYAGEIPLVKHAGIKDSVINVRDIYYLPVCYHNELYKLDDKNLYEVLIKFVNYQENIKQDKIYKLIVDDVKNKISDLQASLCERNVVSKIKK